MVKRRIRIIVRSFFPFTIDDSPFIILASLWSNREIALNSLRFPVIKGCVEEEILADVIGRLVERFCRIARDEAEFLLSLR